MGLADFRDFFGDFSADSSSSRSFLRSETRCRMLSRDRFDPDFLGFESDFFGDFLGFFDAEHGDRVCLRSISESQFTRDLKSSSDSDSESFSEDERIKCANWPSSFGSREFEDMFEFWRLTRGRAAFGSCAFEGRPRLP